MHTALKTLIAASGLAAALAASAQPFAGYDLHEIDARQARQAERIERGIERGQITREEARMLRREQRTVAHFEAQYKADGFVSRDERRELTKLLDRVDDRIRLARHDADVRRRG
jgi:hypothetical protein